MQFMKPTLEDFLEHLDLPRVALIGADRFRQDLLLFDRAAVHLHHGLVERVPPQGIICLNSPGQLPPDLEETVKRWRQTESRRLFIDTSGMQGISCGHDPSIKQPNRHARRRADRSKR